MLSEPSVDLFSTCPASTSVAKDRYVQRVAEVARWSEQSGCKGILLYSDNSLLDPWLLAHIIIQNTTALCPLVAVQPVYMHPYAVAKQITSFAYLYGRRLYLNMVAGGFKNDLDALSDTTPHDKRYARLVEYTTIISRLLTSPAPLTYEGDFHSVAMLKLTPPLPEALAPGIFISGSSEADSRRRGLWVRPPSSIPEPPMRKNACPTISCILASGSASSPANAMLTP